METYSGISSGDFGSSSTAGVTFMIVFLAWFMWNSEQDWRKFFNELCCMTCLRSSGDNRTNIVKIRWSAMFIGPVSSRSDEYFLENELAYSIEYRVSKLWTIVHLPD